MGNLVGYARVSTTEQELALQQDALNDAGCVKVFCDHTSGATTTRPELDKCLEFLRPGDVLTVWRIDRLGRSVKHLIETVETLGDRGVEFKSLTENIDTTTLAVNLFSIYSQQSLKWKDVLYRNVRKRV